MPASLLQVRPSGVRQAIPSALITVATPARTTGPQGAFGGQLPGPFTACAGIGLPPYPDSL